jgi:hypothetical protein
VELLNVYDIYVGFENKKAPVLGAFLMMFIYCSIAVE